MNTLADRRFQHMLGLSVLLHGALLLALPRLPVTPPALPTIVASIRLVMPEASAPAQPAPAAQPAPEQTPERTAPAPRPSRAERAEALPVLAAPQPARPLVRPRPAAATPLESAAQPTTPPASQPAMPTEIAVAAPRSAEPTPVLPAATPHPTAQRASTEAIDSYRRQLTDLFAREHEYPRVAAMRGWEGEVRLRLRVARRGQLLGVRVDRSSGFEVLDQDALALLEGHGKLPPLPEALEVAEIEVVVPITYRLRKAT